MAGGSDEHRDPERAESGYPGRRPGGAPFSGTVGILVGTLTGAALATVLSDAQMHAFGWRVPFVLGGVLGLFALYIRLRMPETETFREVTAAEPVERRSVVRSVVRSIARSIAANPKAGSPSTRPRPAVQEAPPGPADWWLGFAGWVVVTRFGGSGSLLAGWVVVTRFGGSGSVLDELPGTRHAPGLRSSQ